jgi:peptidoglycan/xylan/chitin deacetylase (PgdA/CDA1 family)
MNEACPDLRQFWGLGPPTPSEPGPLRVEVGPKTQGRVVALELEDELRPPWLGPGERVFVWLANGPADAQAAGRPLAHLVEGERRSPAVLERSSEIVFRFDPDEAIAGIVNERYLQPRRPIHSYLPIPYGWVPGRLRLVLFRLLTRRRASAGIPFPAWPVDLSIEALRWAFRRALELAAGRSLPRTHWPDGKGYALVLSHDVDTRRGFELIPEIAALERSLGFVSTWFIVGNQYPIEAAVLDRLRQQGHEVGLHGDRHDNRLGYLSRSRMVSRLRCCAELAAGFEMRGFRAPSLLETPTLRELLQESFGYTSDVPDTERDSLIAPHRGCVTCFPFMKQGMLEIPITLPADDKLLVAGLTEAGMLDVWRSKLARIREVGGVAQLLVHSEPHLWRRSRGAYARLLGELASDEAAWRTTLGQLAQRWREITANG